MGKAKLLGVVLLGLVCGYVWVSFAILSERWCRGGYLYIQNSFGLLIIINDWKSLCRVWEGFPLPSALRLILFFFYIKYILSLFFSFFFLGPPKKRPQRPQNLKLIPT